MCPLEHMACYCLKYIKQLGTRVRCLLLLITSYIFLHTLCRFLSDETMTLTIVRDDPFLNILFCCPLNDFWLFLKEKSHDSSLIWFSIWFKFRCPVYGVGRRPNKGGFLLV